MNGFDRLSSMFRSVKLLIRGLVGWGGSHYENYERSIKFKIVSDSRKKLRYQYLDDIIEQREKANDKLREELAT